ncbi:MAG: hypothetical protein VCG02_09540 [Verrucomicrobiota bacterium]
MKWCLILFLAFASVAWTDTLELISGEVLEGEMLSENARELEFEISRTRSRSYRNVLIVSHDVIKKISRTTPKPQILPEITEDSRLSNDTPKEVKATYSLAKLQDLLRQNKSLMEDGKYDESIALYKSVVDEAYEASKVETNLLARMELATVEESGYKYWIVALEGKGDSLEEKERRLEVIIEGEVDIAEDNLAKHRNQTKHQNQTRTNSSGSSRPVVRLGTGRTRSTVTNGGPVETRLKLRYEQALNRKRQFDAWAKNNAEDVKNLEAEAALLKEKAKQLSKELYTLKRQARELERLRR